MTQAEDSAKDDGIQEEPTSEDSKKSGGQRGSATEADLRAELADLNKKFDQLLRATQSNKDRAVKKVGEKVEALEGDVRELLRVAQREGKTIQDVVTELDTAEERESRQLLLEMARSYREGNFPSQSSRQTAKQGVDVSEVLSDLDLDETDVRVKEFRSREFSSTDEAYREGAKLQRTIRTTQPTEADRASEIGKPPRPAGKQEELMKEYREGSKNLYGRALLLYKQEMRGKGLEIS